MVYTDSESLHMVLCCFAQINERSGAGSVRFASWWLCGTSKGSHSTTDQPGAPTVGCWLPRWASQGASCLSHSLEKFFLTGRPICVLCQMKCIEPSHCSLQHDRKSGLDVFLRVLHVSVKPVSLLLKYTCFPSLSWYPVPPPLIRR